jgi:hypothetical protein
MAAAALWLLLFGALGVMTGLRVSALFSVAPLIAATVADERRTAIFAGAAVALTGHRGGRRGAGGSVRSSAK